MLPVRVRVAASGGMDGVISRCVVGPAPCQEPQLEYRHSDRNAQGPSLMHLIITLFRAMLLVNYCVITASPTLT